MKPEMMSRATLISALRAELAGRANGEMSICRLAAEQGIFCRGFQRYSDDDLKRRFGWVVRHNPKITRPELEEVADRWQMARQDVDGFATACDVQQMEHDSCKGWDDFTNQDLAKFIFELTGKQVIAVSE